MTNSYDPVVRLLLAVGVVFLAAVLALNVWSATASNRADLNERTMRIENQLQYVSCLLLIAPDQRTPEAIAECQVDP